jgi:TetR/AcrR family transcriptional regulator, transcriptional repressor for nem operon
MRVTREQAVRTRERILEAAAQLFCERGFNGIGVADLMKEAGLTHGGFYVHFESKEDLMAQACEHASARSKTLFGKLAERAPDHALREIARAYLSPHHRDDPGAGCLMAALASEASRQGAPVRKALTESLRSTVELLTNLIPGRSKHAKREKAIATYASLVGAMILARAVEDRALSNEILDAVHTSITR